MEEEVKAVMRIIIRKLQGMNKWGGAHTALRNIAGGMPTQFSTSPKGKRIIKKAIKQLINNGFMLAKPSTGEVHVSLNTKKKKEIIEFKREQT